MNEMHSAQENDAGPTASTESKSQLRKPHPEPRQRRLKPPSDVTATARAGPPLAAATISRATPPASAGTMPGCPTSGRGRRTKRSRRARAKRQRYAARLRLRIAPAMELLAARWPAAFPADPDSSRPWAMGIFEDLAKAHPDISRSLLRATMREFAASGAYQAALAKGGPRYDLHGQPNGIVTPDQQAKAAKRVSPGEFVGGSK
jgi:hypothetical protein